MSLPASVSLSNRIAVVTGGSRGIGKAISLELARRGASVAIVYTNPQKSGTAKETVDEIKAVGAGAGGEKVNAIAIRADVREPTAYERIVKETLEGFGTENIHILVHNAGLGSATPTPEVTSQTFSDVFDTNVRGPFFLTQAALPYIPSGGRIILVSSTSARLATVGFTTPIYTASKAALEGLARSWAYEFGPRGITVNAISPGLVETDFASAMDPTVIAGVRENYAKITPFGRSGTPDDIAQIAAFLASEGSRWVTGSTVSASGGRILY